MVSLYGIWDVMLESGDRYVEATLHRAISDLTVVFQERSADQTCRHVNTFLHRADPANKPHQLDFFLTTPPLRERLVNVWADPDPQWYAHSDHRPILATFEL